jgi:hypothetical protein
MGHDRKAFEVIFADKTSQKINFHMEQQLEGGGHAAPGADFYFVITPTALISATRTVDAVARRRCHDRFSSPSRARA